MYLFIHSFWAGILIIQLDLAILPDSSTRWGGTVVTVVVVVIYDSYDYNPLENTQYCTVHSCELLYQHPKNTSLVIST